MKTTISYFAACIFIVLCVSVGFKHIGDGVSKRINVIEQAIQQGSK